MKKTSSVVIKLPKMQEDEELNVKSYDYARRTAKPILNQFIISPFETALKERLFNEAIQEVGQNSEGIINISHKSSLELNDMNFQLDAQPNTRVSIETTLTNTKEFLKTALTDNRMGRTRKGIKRRKNQIYIDVCYLMEKMGDFKAETATTINTKKISILDATGKKIENEPVSLMRVYYSGQYSSLNHKNAEEYWKARSLKSRIEAFEKKFKNALIEKFSAEAIEEKKTFGYELSDGIGVRYLFSPETSTQYGKIFDAFLKQETEEVTSTSGDLNALEELISAESYEKEIGTASISVALDGNNARIERTKKKGDWIKTEYRVLEANNKIYVHIEDVLKTMEDLTQLNTKTSTKTKIDFFAAPPDYLRD